MLISDIQLGSLPGKADSSVALELGGLTASALAWSIKDGYHGPLTGHGRGVLKALYWHQQLSSDLRITFTEKQPRK